MKFPTIHLNGSGAAHLLDTLCGALEACRTAVDALDKAAPNGRDYYPQGGHALAEAMVEHDARVRSILLIMKDLNQIVRHIEDEEDRRASVN